MLERSTHYHLNRLKEELIRELVKNSQTNKRLNEAYLTKIQQLEQVSYCPTLSIVRELM